MRSAVRFAAWMPARRAVWRGSPLATVFRRMAVRAAAPMCTSASATASRMVSALPPTSTIRTRPRASTCDSLPVLRAAMLFFAREKERQALERDGQIDVLQLDDRRNLQRAGREIQNRPDPGLHDGVDHRLG